MTKFNAPTSNIFEIVKTSARPQRAFLNRQIIMLLSALGTPDDIFMELQDVMVKQTNLMMTDTTVAKKIFRRRSMDTHVAKLTFGMLKANQLDVEEPFLYAILEATRLNILQTLKKKARIFVEKSYLLFGTVDETSTLREDEVFVQVPITDESDSFDSEEVGQTMSVIVGDVFVMRNPSLHPGDIRKMKAVRCRQLNHVKNCVVFSSKGERPAPNMMSGGDLDGDEYFVCYDSRLLPKETFPPMDYNARERKVVDNVDISDVKQFFVDYIENDKLGAIANKHLALADQSPQGVFDERCIRLCKAHSDAVDFPKSGNPAVIDRDIHVEVYPDFMGKPNSKRSNRILGRLYREIVGEEDLDHIADNPCLTYQRDEEIGVDPMFLVDGYEKYLDEAESTKSAYDRDLRAIMSKYKIKTEAEAITGHILDFRPIHRRKLYDVQEMVAAEVSDHILKYRKLFAKDVLPPHHSDPRFSFLVNTDTEKKAAAWYYVTYSEQDYQSESEEEEEAPHRQRNRRLLSFAWLVYDVLLKIRRQ
ncbi:RNA dependent RNA polymerase-domain-containing protein [Endogone sp. FLAS-F59071]|nr:RNA dependent RNA polymerase-domain-containing protein [Endogone sp. FLAS-F59071]|eukprot:RUS13307.1 RNA dependent RNA polymerase-domain-containing protein [Endogone sp. FLAS-F59071]